MDSPVSRLHALITRLSMGPRQAKGLLPVQSVQASVLRLRRVGVGTTDAQAPWRLFTPCAFAVIVRHEQNGLGAATAQRLTCIHYTPFLSIFKGEKCPVVRKWGAEICVA